MNVCVTCLMGLQVGAQWAVEQEAIQIGSVIADFAQPTSTQQVRQHSTTRLNPGPPDKGSKYDYSWC